MAVYPHRLRKVSARQELTFVIAGLCGVCLYYLLENIALTYTMASNVGVIISVVLLFTAIMSHVFLKEEGDLSALFRFMEFCSNGTGCCEDKYIYLHGTSGHCCDFGGDTP